jgi:hypothetical protein
MNDDSNPTQMKLYRNISTPLQAVVTVHIGECKRKFIPATGRGGP